MQARLDLKRPSPAAPRAQQAPGEGELLDALRLARSRNVGPSTWIRLVRRFGTPGRALQALPDLAARGGAAGFQVASLAQAERELEAGMAAGVRLLVLGRLGYPEALSRIPDPPPILWLRGGVEALGRPFVAIVGARNASAIGLRMARELAAGLGGRGLWTVSGLARGIDGAAHDAALAVEGGGTAAVVAGCVQAVYPSEHAALAARIAERGAVISEAPIGLEPLARHFPRRNRVIAGLSRAVVLIEAAARSGSLITADFALEQGREVLAVPGSPLDPRSEGGNALIRQGATLVRNAEDVIEALEAAAEADFGRRHGMLDLAPPADAEDPREDDRASATPDAEGDACRDDAPPGLPDADRPRSSASARQGSGPDGGFEFAETGDEFARPAPSGAAPSRPAASRPAASGPAATGPAATGPARREPSRIDAAQPSPVPIAPAPADPAPPGDPSTRASPTNARSTGASPTGAAGSPHAGAPSIRLSDAGLRARVRTLLGMVPVEEDELSRLAGAPLSALADVLLELELAGRLDRRPGGLVALRPE